jgi:hypothetical protein
MACSQLHVNSIYYTQSAFRSQGTQQSQLQANTVAVQSASLLAADRYSNEVRYKKAAAAERDKFTFETGMDYGDFLVAAANEGSVAAAKLSESTSTSRGHHDMRARHVPPLLYKL